MSESTPDSSGTLSRRTAVMSVGTALSRLTGFVRIQVLAAALGITFLSDAYTLANNTPNIIYELVLGGVLSATLIPVFVSIQNGDDEKEIDNAVAAVWGVSLALLLAISLLIFITAPWIISLYTAGNHKPHVDALRDVGSSMLRYFAPQILFYGFISVATALLNTKRKFGAPMFAPLFNNVIVIAMFVGFRTFFSQHTVDQLRHTHAPIAYLGILTTAGVAAMALALIPSLKRAKVSLRPSWNPGHVAVKKLVALSTWTFGFVVGNQVTLLIVLALASRQAGGPTAYTFAYIFFLLPHGVFSVSIMSAQQPELADAWSRHDLDAFREQVSIGVRLILLVMIPAAIGFVMLARPIVNLTLAYGAARKSSAIYLVSGSLGWMAIGLPAFSIYLYLTRCFQAMHDTKTAFYLYLVENGVNVILAFMLMSPFGVQGLSFAFSAAYIVGAIIAFAVLTRKLGGFTKESILNMLGLSLLAGVGLAAVLAIVRIVTRVGDYSSAITVIVGVVVGAPTYFFLGRIFGIREWNSLMRGPLARFSRGDAS